MFSKCFTCYFENDFEYQVAAMVLISWFKELKIKDISVAVGLSILGGFRSWLLDLLSCTNPAFPTKDSLLPYAELSRTYGKMRNEASQLHHTVEASGMFPDLLNSVKLNLETLTADDAISFASKLPSLVSQTSAEASTERDIFDELESLKQRLLTTSGYLKCIEVYLTYDFSIFNGIPYLRIFYVFPVIFVVVLIFYFH